MFMGRMGVNAKMPSEIYFIEKTKIYFLYLLSKDPKNLHNYVVAKKHIIILWCFRFQYLF